MAAQVRVLGCLSVRAYPGRRREAVLEQPRHERLDFRQRDDVVAEVARRQDAMLTPQTTRRAAVVADGDDRGDIGRVLLQAAQHRGHARAAADTYDARAALADAVLVDTFEQALVGVAAR